MVNCRSRRWRKILPHLAMGRSKGWFWLPGIRYCPRRTESSWIALLPVWTCWCRSTFILMRAVVMRILFCRRSVRWNGNISISSLTCWRYVTTPDMPRHCSRRAPMRGTIGKSCSAWGIASRRPGPWGSAWDGSSNDASAPAECSPYSCVAAPTVPVGGRFRAWPWPNWRPRHTALT